MDAATMFTPQTTGFNAGQIAEDLFDYYVDAEENGVGVRLMQVDSAADMLKLLVPATCQTYTNRIYEVQGEADDREEELDAEEAVLFETLEQMGLLRDWTKDDDKDEE